MGGMGEELKGGEGEWGGREVEEEVRAEWERAEEWRDVVGKEQTIGEERKEGQRTGDKLVGEGGGGTGDARMGIVGGSLGLRVANGPSSRAFKRCGWLGLGVAHGDRMGYEGGLDSE